MGTLHHTVGLWVISRCVMDLDPQLLRYGRPESRCELRTSVRCNIDGYAKTRNPCAYECSSTFYRSSFAKCLRIITFFSYLKHTEPLFQNLEILNFKQLVIHRIAMLMFKNSKEMVPIAIRMLFARNDQYHNYNTRQSRSLQPSVGKGEAIYRPFSFHGVNIWNYLSKHLPTKVSYNILIN